MVKTSKDPGLQQSAVHSGTSRFSFGGVTFHSQLPIGRGSDRQVVFQLNEKR